MKNKQLKAFLVGLFVSLLIIATFFIGAVADRLFVIKPLDVIFDKVTPSVSQQQPTMLGGIISEDEYRTPEIVELASNSVVTVSVRKQQVISQPGSIFEQFGLFGLRGQQQPEVEEVQRDIGTGFVVEDNLIVTNKHVVSQPEAEYSVFDYQNNEFQVTNIYRDPVLDLAILQVEDFSAKPLPLGNSDEVRVGESVIAIGTALGEFRHTVTKGVVSGLGRGIDARGASEFVSLQGVIQTDAAINPGNSGGPLINIISGQVVGVNVATTMADNISFAIPINVIKQSIENFEQTGRFDRAFLGVRYQMISKRSALFNEVPQGAYVLEVVPGSSADEAGLEEGDIVTKIDGKQLAEGESLAQIINQKKVGERLDLTFWRDQETKKTTVELKVNNNQ